jgi:hypothetical protein
VAFSLHRLATGRWCLEFASQDHAALQDAIGALFGPIRGAWLATAAELQFGGASFVYQDEWDEPCVIALTAEGDAVLAAVHARLRSV